MKNKAIRKAVVEASGEALLTHPEDDDDYESMWVDGHIDLGKVSEAVLKAIREPTPEQIETMLSVGILEVRLNDHEVKAIWQAAIDSLLLGRTALWDNFEEEAK